MEYTGYKIVTLDDYGMDMFYSGKGPLIAVEENEYVIIENERHEAVDYYRFTKGELKKLKYPLIENIYAGIIKPRDSQQYCAIDMLQNREIPVKLIRGVYGSGKDHLMFNEALSLVEKGEFEKIVFIRPNVTLANIPQIGYLPNGVDEKLGWTMAPLYDKIGGEEGINRLVNAKQFEMVPLLFIRGRSFENSIVYVTEAQNIDSSIAKVLLSRIGDHSELWLNGDNHQTDSRIFDKDNGLTLMVDRLKGNSLFGYVYLPNTHRSNVANLSNLLD